jgi:hypothetical protein
MENPLAKKPVRARFGKSSGEYFLVTLVQPPVYETHAKGEEGAR